MNTYDIANLKLGAWDVTWGSTEFGAVDDVTPTLDLILKEKRVGSLGPIDLGHWILGLGGMIVTNFREITAAQYQALFPWWTSGSIPLQPSGLNTDLYSYAALLKLHPNEIAEATTTFDINLLKAVPKKVTPPNRNGDVPDVVRVEWQFYPDRAQLGTIKAYGYIGAPPS
ncbi:hypothetical protein [Humisphaera borealis]|uniref:Uncharacterized protein n=1 Tax=Humisphaera borealis TaxID=2807512 RepID=A0A7M2WZH5_9BACT|nr:hypothetical protein [Humisphaera borealis]QOV90886.1 hypothetical protein IPV69_05870 [Humisphaera borealis]